ncbi:MAG: ATP-binding cassette domain-containing protein [Peptococcaceae bacterium]|nr:ATP-binding cassette domain-containing protein [Peptococcaceae bacterium]
MHILEVSHLTKKYNNFTAVNNISFNILEGELFGFLGPNGSGKTTTINMLTGLAKITSGSIKLLEFDYPHELKKAQQIIGIVPDESNLYEELDGFGNLCFCASLYGMEKTMREGKARQLLEEFDLTGAGNKPFKSYSKGMKRKLTIAAGIIHEPKILFLDEPTTGIDVASARRIRQLIKKLNKNGTTVFLTTHYIEEAENLCHRVAFIVKGEIIKIGTVSELIQEAQQESIVQFTLAGGAGRLQQALREKSPAIFNVEVLSDTVLRVNTPQLISLSPYIKLFEENNLTLYEAKIIRPSLEEVFVKITGIEAEHMKKDREGRKK